MATTAITGAERFKLRYQAEQERQAKQAANRAALGKAPEVPRLMRDELGRAPTKAQKEAYQSDRQAANKAANLAATNANRAALGKDPRLSPDEKVARKNTSLVADGMAPKPYTTAAGKQAYSEAKRLATLEAMRPGTAAAKAATAANRAAQQEASYQAELGRTYHTKSAFKKGGSVTSAPKRAKSGVTRGDGCAIRGKTKGRFV